MDDAVVGHGPYLPYWRTQLVPGGNAGGIIATAAVDEQARRVYFSTAPGNDSDVFSPQRPTVHALDLDTGAVVWENRNEANADASFAPTSAIPGLIFVGKDVGGRVRVYDAPTGTRCARLSSTGGGAVNGGRRLVDDRTRHRSHARKINVQLSLLLKIPRADRNEPWSGSLRQVEHRLP